MVGLGWILAIIIGALAGWLAGKIMHSTHGLLMDIVLGIVGAIIGNFLLMTIFGATMGGIVGQLLVAVVGACLLIGIARMFTGWPRPHSVDQHNNAALLTPLSPRWRGYFSPHTMELSMKPKFFLSASAMALTVALSGSVFAATATPDLVPSGYTIANTDALASRVINAKVYSGPNADAAEIGYVKDLVLGASGQISAVVLGIGGFLGAGEKDVAVAYSQVHWTLATDGSLRGVLSSTKDALAAAPDFKFPDYTAVAQASSSASMAQTSSSLLDGRCVVLGSAAGGCRYDDAETARCGITEGRRP